MCIHLYYVWYVYPGVCIAAALQGSWHTPCVFVRETRWPAAWPPGCFRQAGADLLPSAHLFALLHLLAFDLWPPIICTDSQNNRLTSAAAAGRKKSTAPWQDQECLCISVVGFAAGRSPVWTFGCRWTVSSSLTSSISPSGSGRLTEEPRGENSEVTSVLSPPPALLPVI